MEKKKRKKVYTPLTKRTWVKKFKTEFDGDTGILTGYMECVNRQTPVLLKMAKQARSLEELQGLILQFAQQQSDVVVDMKNAWSSSKADKYGFSAEDAHAAERHNFSRIPYKQLSFPELKK